MQHTANHEQPIQCSGPALAAAQSHSTPHTLKPLCVNNIHINHSAYNQQDAQCILNEPQSDIVRTRSFLGDDRRVSAAAAAAEIGGHEHRGDDMGDEVGERKEVGNDNGLGDGALVLEEDDGAVVPSHLCESRALHGGEIRVGGDGAQVSVHVVGGEDVVVDELLLDIH